MKIRRLFLILVLHILLIASCTSSSPPPINTLNGYTLATRAGVTVFDETSQVASVTSQARQWHRVARLLQEHASLAITPQASSSLAVNVFASVLKDGAPVQNSTTLQVAGPKKPYAEPLVLKAGETWASWLALESQGAGPYTVNATTQGIELSDRIMLNPELQPRLGTPRILTVMASHNTVHAQWEPVLGAVSYLVAIDDPFQSELAFVAAVTDPEVIGTGLTLTNTALDLLVVALSWDITAPRTAPYPSSLPEYVNASAAAKSFSLNAGASPKLDGIAIGMVAPPGESATAQVTLSAEGKLPLVYALSFQGDDRLLMSTTSAGVLHPGEELAISFSGSCPPGPSVYVGQLSIETNAYPFLLPVTLECRYPLMAERRYNTNITTETRYRRVDSVSFNADGSKLVAALSATNSWEARLRVLNESGMAEGVIIPSGDASNWLVKWTDANEIVSLTNSGYRLTAWSGLDLAQVWTHRLSRVAHWALWNESGSRAALITPYNDWDVLNLQTQQFLFSPSTQGSTLSSAAWSPDGSKFMVLLDSETEANILDGTSGAPISTVLFADVLVCTGSYGNAFRWVSQHRLVLTCSNPEIVDLASGTVLTRIALGNTSVIEPSPDGSFLAVHQTSLSTVEIYSGVSGVRLLDVPKPDGELVTTMGWSRDGTRLAIGTVNGTLELWDLAVLEP